MVKMAYHHKEGGVIFHTWYNVIQRETSWVWEKVYESTQVCDCPDPEEALRTTIGLFSAYLRASEG